MGSGKTSLCVCLIAVCTLLTSWPGASPALAAAGDGYRLISEGERTLTFTVDLPSYELEEFTYEGQVYSRPFVTGYAPFSPVGSPDLPVFTILVAVPPGGDARVTSFARSDERVIENVRIAPVPEILAAGEGPEKAPYYQFGEGPAYQETAPYPGLPVWIDQKGRMRHQDVVRVYVSPFIYEPGLDRLRAAGRTTVTVTIEGRTTLRGSMRPDDAWEGVYGGTLLNHERGRAWRTAEIPALGSRTLTNDRVKILIDRTGLFAVTFDTLSAAGFPGGISIDDIFMYTEEFAAGGTDLPDTMDLVELAIQVTDSDSDGILSGGDEVVFYGQNFYDQFGWQGGEDYFFDRNVYWLSWADGEHARIASRSGWLDAAAPSVPPHFEDFVHVEKDSSFVNFPPTNAPIDFYTWRVYRGNVLFDLPGLAESQPVTLVTKFVSYYYYPDFPRGATIDILVSGCDSPLTDLATIAVSVPSVDQRSLPVEAGVFCEEGNTFRFESGLPADWRPGNVLDWLEAVYRRRYEALDDVLIFTSGGLAGELAFEVESFSGSDILLFDVTDSLSPVGLEVPPERIVPGAEGYTLTFQDTVTTEHTYIALCAPEMVRVGAGQLTFLPPPSLRDASADYVVISHPDFIGELDDLLDHRRAQGYSVLSTTTDQVYDDFGNGMKSDVAIKSFIRNAFLIGGTQFVLLVGDASTDRRGLLLDPPEGDNASDVDYLPGHNIFVSDGNPPNREIRPYEYWFVTLEGDDDPYPDLYIGRLSVGSTAEAEGAVAKILNSENDPGDDPWKKRALFVADDYYSKFCPQSSDRNFEIACDSAAIIATDFAVVAPETTKYYLERCTRFDQTEQRENGECLISSFQTVMYTRNNCTPVLRSLLNAGSFLVNYQGHANRELFTYENLIRDYDSPFTSYTDIRGLTNFEKPFVFLGFGCWISDFQSSAEGTVGDAIGEKFVLNPFGAGSASFASGCAEFISHNREFNPFVMRVIFTHLRGVDVAGNPLPARVLLGEAMTTALIRFAASPQGSATHLQKHVLLGDPAMVMDMGPPLLEATANDSLIDETYVFTGEASDTLHIVSLVKDEEAIMELGVSIAEGGLVTPVDPASYETLALVDIEFTRSRSYELKYDHVPHLGSYSVRIGAEDYSGKTSGLDINVNTGSAEFFANNDPLEEGGLLVIGQYIRVLLGRPDPFTEEDIEVVVDTTAAEDFADYNVEMKDAEGKEWEVSFAPSLSAGDHTVEASVRGLKSRRGFSYVPARVDYYVEHSRLLDNDFVSGAASYRVIVNAEAGITEDDISMELNGEPLAAEFEADSSGVSFEATFDLELGTGDYELATVIFDFRVPVIFVVSDVLQLLDVSVYPSPFPRETNFYYTLSQDAREVKLEIYTVSGRKIFDAGLKTAAGYNEYRWDGRDVAGDRIANGTYLYKIVAKTSSREKEFTGWVVKVE